ncbi:hypothetical protein HAX54_004427 [Datura stramonium]|uniref:Uncharacterized protein n=1 Tax=Datura stramonium TaxID=4076 RepID=A0ABS8T6Z0_DATST|nr:hypothetical protein [Datura stramonium]
MHKGLIAASCIANDPLVRRSRSSLALMVYRETIVAGVEAASLGIIPLTSLKGSPIVVDVRNLHIHAAQVYSFDRPKRSQASFGCRCKNTKHIHFTPCRAVTYSDTGEKTIKIAGRINRAVAALLRRLGLPE